MVREVEIKVYPDQLGDTSFIWKRAASRAKVSLEDVDEVVIVRKSIDARGSRPVYRMRCAVYVGERRQERRVHSDQYQDVRNGKRIIIIGAGPAGYFAALQCLKEGMKPIILERGKDVQARRRDLRAIQQIGEVNPHSNYCFGEGGAGTYSDGKLYTRSHKRGKIIDVLEILVEHGATEEILIDAHPHIGSNKLPKIIANIRSTIEHFGGEVHFDQFVTDFDIKSGKMEAVITADGQRIEGTAFLLATGHSARDIFKLLDRLSIYIEAKPFALGLRIEHPQEMIDEIQYNQCPREPQLPASSYKVVTQVQDIGVFSFCMCPGGLIVPAATAPGEIVVNGMSPSKRDSPYANSGFVTSIETEELMGKGYTGTFGNMDFQAEVERSMYEAGDGSQKAPAQRVADFVAGTFSSSLNDTSYIPGLFSANLKSLLPDFVYERLRKGLVQISKKMPAYLTNEANLVGVESRTSSPIRIPRNRETYMHDQIEGLYPCGEGAGYAGGILSAAMDGQNCVKAMKVFIER